jgi:hypothetical protein
MRLTSTHQHVRRCVKQTPACRVLAEPSYFGKNGLRSNRGRGGGGDLSKLLNPRQEPEGLSGWQGQDLGPSNAEDNPLNYDPEGIFLSQLIYIDENGLIIEWVCVTDASTWRMSIIKLNQDSCLARTGIFG